MYRKFAFIAIPLLMLMAACVKPYYPEIDKYDKIVVIDGILTDDGLPPVVNLSYSYQVETHRSEAIKGATVFISSSDGNRYDLTETDDGTYTYTQSMFDVKVGMTFRLIVEFDGNVYSSSIETVLPVAKLTECTMAPVLQGSEKGADIYVSSNGTAEESRYYSWGYEETWKFEVPLYTPNALTRRICYAKNISKGILIGTTESYATNSFSGHKLYNIISSSPKMSIRYSTLIKQYSISRDTYMYLQHVQKMNENNGSLFDPIPSSMNGNISSESAKVIGNFQVSSTSKLRFYIDRSDLPRELLISPGMEQCSMAMALKADKRRQDSLISSGMVIMDTSIVEHDVVYRYASEKYCFDCTATGAPNTPPSWWEEKK